MEESSKAHRTWFIISSYHLLLIQDQGWKGGWEPTNAKMRRIVGIQEADGLVSERASELMRAKLKGFPRGGPVCRQE